MSELQPPAPAESSCRGHAGDRDVVRVRMPSYKSTRLQSTKQSSPLELASLEGSAEAAVSAPPAANPDVQRETGAADAMPWTTGTSSLEGVSPRRV